MKVDIKNVEKKHGGMFSKKTLYGVELTVTFTEEEKAIIEERRLAKDIILERSLSADKDEFKEANRGLMSKLATAALSGSEALHPHLTIAKLLKGPDLHFFNTPLEAKDYTDTLKAQLPNFKAHVMLNATTGKDDSFEL
jgi:hypothetical protein